MATSDSMPFDEIYGTAEGSSQDGVAHDQPAASDPGETRQWTDEEWSERNRWWDHRWWGSTRGTMRGGTLQESVGDSAAPALANDPWQGYSPWNRWDN